MKHFKRQHLAILPLLSILSMSPGVMESKFANRHIASVEEVVKGHPKLEVLVSKVDPKSLLKDENLDKEKLRAKGDALIESVKKVREEFKKDQSDKVVVEGQRKSVEAIVIDMLLVENAVKELNEKKALSDDENAVAADNLVKQKDIIEGLLTDLEVNEVLVAKASEPKVEEPKKEEEKPVVVAEEPKKEEPKKEEEKPVVVVAEEPKKEEPKKEEEKKEVCESDEKNKVLTAQIEQLMKQQNQIMQTMMGMAQMMVSMHQQNQQQPNPYYANGPGFNVQNPYQYNQPFTAGNWVYMPNGFQQNQPNIFAQPMQQPQQQQGIFPDQMHQQTQSSWNLQPDPRYQYQPTIPYGNFGNNGLSFNMQNMVPTISQG